MLSENMALGMTRIAAAVLLAVVAMARQQALAENEPKVVTLLCDGTATDTHITNSTPYPGAAEQLPKVGVIVNLNERTVSLPKLTSWARLIA
jgi:hypothetical protein